MAYAGGLSLDRAGNIYFADVLSGTIRKWTAANSNVTQVVSGLSLYPVDAAVDGAGNVYIPISSHNEIQKWAAADSNVTTLAAELGNPQGVAVDGASTVYIADTGNNVIKQLKAAITTNLTMLVSSNLNGPQGVAVDGARNVYIGDSGNNAIKELPYVFVDPTARFESGAAGNDSLPVVLPATANLSGPFTPTNDQPWLAITGVSNGVVSFSFTGNTSGSNRTAHITLLGQTIAVTQSYIVPPILTGWKTLANGAFQFGFSNSQTAAFTVLSTTNLSLPLTNWTVLGAPSNIAAGMFQFTTQPITNEPLRFYAVRSP
jgi:hypothetical protein